MQNALIALIVVVLAGGGYYWYSQSAPVSDMNNTETESTQEAMMEDGTMGASDSMQEDSGAASGAMIDIDADVSSTMDAGAALKEITVTSSGLAFNQKTLSVKKGDRVRITYVNGGGTHDLRIEGYDVGTKVIQSGATETFEFVADQAGTFEYYCSVGNHRERGMKGTLTVTQ